MASLNSAAQIAVKLQKLSNEATEKSFQYNSKEAASARSWQTQMSNTSHQREVKDLIAAGLNPVLSSGGQGAQSYTTSSASAQAENAASAVGNIYGAQMSADATRAAAASNAAAMKAAAAQQAAAARYAASLQYAASVYHSDKAYEAKKYSVDHSKTANIAGLFSNSVDKATGFTLSDFKKTANNGAAIANNKNGLYLINQNKGLTFNNLSWRSRQFLQSTLRKYDMPVNMTNQRLAFNAFVLQKANAVKAFASIINSHSIKMNNARTRANKSFKSYYGANY